MTRIADTFIIFDELDMLEFRLRLLDPHIDRFVIIESPITFTGQPKPLYFQENRDRFAFAAGKIAHAVVNIDISHLDMTYKPKGYDPDAPQRQVEAAQRNAQGQLAAQLGWHSDDMVLFSDIDEIPDPAVLARLRGDAALRAAIVGAPHMLSQTMFYYNAHNRLRAVWEQGTVVASFADTQAIPPHKLRMLWRSLPHIADAGWHFSYFMTPERIARKIQNLGGQELNDPAYRDIAHIIRCLEQGKDVFNRADVEIVQDGQTVLPPAIWQALAQFPMFVGDYGAAAR